MTDITDAELREKIEGCEKTIESSLEIWDQIPPERKPYTRLGLNAKGIAVYSLFLGEVDKAHEWFVKASEWYREVRNRRKGRTNEPQMLLWTLLTAVLSGDEETAETAAESAAVVENRDPEYFYHFDQCLAGLIDGDDERVLGSAEELSEREDGAAETLDYYDGLGTACAAIATDDFERLDRGLAEILDRHEELVPTFGKTMDDGLVCYPATALAALAQRREIPVEDLDALDGEYVPLELIE